MILCLLLDAEGINKRNFLKMMSKLLDGGVAPLLLNAIKRRESWSKAIANYQSTEQLKQHHRSK